MARTKKDEKSAEKDKAGSPAKDQSAASPASQEGEGKSQTTPESPSEEQEKAGAPVVESPAAPKPPVDNPESPASPTPPAEEERAKGPKRLRIRNKAYAGMKVGARTGSVEFDEEGIAEVCPEDYALFKRVPGYEDVQ